jgi:hypothetical protein
MLSREQENRALFSCPWLRILGHDLQTTNHGGRGKNRSLIIFAHW